MLKLSSFPKVWLWLKKALLIAFVSAFTLSVALILVDRWVSWQTQDKIYYEAESLPNHDVAMVLGTSKYIGKKLNDFYTNRISTAIQLFQDNKVTSYLLSGDNAHRSYNEPWTMKRDLLKAGVPEDAIYLDYAGFRTLDSVVRAKEIFEADDFIIITQAFHCERALYIADYHDINAVCLAVPGPEGTSGWFVRLREVLARANALVDLYIIDKQPKFLGPKVPIENIEGPQKPSESISGATPTDTE
ncbi:Protein sanA [Vibrio nigripulchritudo SFn27]|uniref:Protein sanA n=1 Tax=Vibrio nigripulchritudo TaxID=28173 RepID=U4K3Z9_9VIBR|nr:ElyC/SanA/YdcF family protein [Vibrio nigripulchritudo]CCN83640.1 Protein sanA [Vibrio nigripulchritudo BLFn1]CCN87354.1 Protein sanA [Vibrio nigripulchritudo SFn27]CCN94733.1 Protein sanA [Vibrio nigripulchritudo ENn2]CCO40726.1 Protein sanA [Vibrio nigripulchritudo SFn135]CCO54803.1 Protein sanA [Vibrio nigripulchritudo Wn13]